MTADTGFLRTPDSFGANAATGSGPRGGPARRPSPGSSPSVTGRRRTPQGKFIQWRRDFFSDTSCRDRPRSVAAGVDHLAAGLGGDRPPDVQRDAVLDELDRAVKEPDVHPARVVRLGADHRDVVVAG